MHGARGLAGLLGVMLMGIVVLPARPAVGPPASGTIEGVVRFTGKLPPPRKVITADGPLLRHDLLVDKKSKGLRDVVVSLLDAPARPRVTNRKAVYVDQKDLQFVPRVVAVQHGQVVRFENSDRFNHSVRATSTVEANNFNFFVGSSQPLDRVFKPQKHPVSIGCSLHAGMSGWVYVFDHPHFTMSGEKGIFRLRQIPPGKLTLLLRHADTGLSTKRPVTVRAGQTVRVEVEWKKVDE